MSLKNESYTLTLWPNGAITLPKKWREKWKAKHFLAKENKRGYLVIIPIMDVEFADDDEDGEKISINIPPGLSQEELMELWQEASVGLEMEEQSKKRRRNK